MANLEDAINAIDNMASGPDLVDVSAVRQRDKDTDAGTEELRERLWEYSRANIRFFDKAAVHFSVWTEWSINKGMYGVWLNIYYDDKESILPHQQAHMYVTFEELPATLKDPSKVFLELCDRLHRPDEGIN